MVAPAFPLTMEKSYSCPDCAFTADRDLVLQVLSHFFSCTSFRCIQDITCGHVISQVAHSPPQTPQEHTNSTQNIIQNGVRSRKENTASLGQAESASLTTVTTSGHGISSVTQRPPQTQQKNTNSKQNKNQNGDNSRRENTASLGQAESASMNIDSVSGHEISPVSQSPQAQQKHTNSKQQKSQTGDKSRRESTVSMGQAESSSLSIDPASGHSISPVLQSSPQLQQKHSNSTQEKSQTAATPRRENTAFLRQTESVSRTVNPATADIFGMSGASTSSSATLDLTFNPYNSPTVREDTVLKESSSTQSSAQNSKRTDQKSNTNTRENLESETDRTLNSQEVHCRVESYYSLKPHRSVFSGQQDNETIKVERQPEYESIASSAEDLRTERFHDSGVTDTPREMLMQAQIKEEPISEEYNQYSAGIQGNSSMEHSSTGFQVNSSMEHSSTGFQGNSSMEQLLGQSSQTLVRTLPQDSCRENLQQLQWGTDASTSAGAGVSAKFQMLNSGHQVQCTPATLVIRCPVCHNTYKSRSALSKHCRLQHIHYPCCTLCCTIFNSAEELQAHRRTMHREEKTFQCKECNTTFGYKRNLLVHLKEQHLEVGQQFPCKECKKVYRTKRALKEHQRTHTNCGKYVCNLCGKCLKSLTGLKGHYLHLHNRVL